MAQIESNGKDMINVVMPKMGESIMEGTVIKWHKQIGETIKHDEILFEISTDKVDTEVPSPAEGVVIEILVREQETVPIDTVVCRLMPSDVCTASPAPLSAATTAGDSMHDSISKQVDTIALNENKSSVLSAGKIVSANRFYSPVVLGVAQKENISLDELSSIQGTGIEGRVTKKDVLQFIERRRSTYAGQSVSKQAADPSTPLKKGIEEIKMDNNRKNIMRHMIASRDTSVHVSGVIEVDMTNIRQLIKSKRASIEEHYHIKINYLSFVAFAAVKALQEFPLVNSTIQGDSILQKKFINLGIAVALEPNGLIVPNIKNAQNLNLISLTKSIADIAERARAKKLVPDDVAEGTFSITNYGVFGTLYGTPIINQPEVAILGMGAVTAKPVVLEVDGAPVIAIRDMMYLTLSHDHRLVDGMLGGKFLSHLKDLLENFPEVQMY